MGHDWQALGLSRGTWFNMEMEVDEDTMNSGSAWRVCPLNSDPQGKWDNLGFGGKSGQSPPHRVA